MKTLLIALTLVSTPALAQSNYYENRYNGSGTQIYGNQGRLNQQFNQVNGYYYDKNTNSYYKGKNINRDAGSFSGNQGNLSYTYDRNQYAPRNLRID
jgi:hypothetical protein